MSRYRLNIDDETSAYDVFLEAATLPELRKLYTQKRSELTEQGRDAWIEAVRVNPDGTETIIEDLMAKTGPGKRGRPAGTTKPDTDRLKNRITRFPDNLWAWCIQQGNASEYLRDLAEKDRAQRGD